jgi:hypothetical protein
MAFALGSGCAAKPEPGPITPRPAPSPAPPLPVRAATAPAATAPTLEACPHGMQASPDGLFDDFRDGDNQVLLLDGRDGYWWIAKADHATVTLPGPEFKASEGGPPGSQYAAHVAGKTDSVDPWGVALGANFLGTGFYDASKYAGVSFKIKGQAKAFVRFKLHDVNTIPDGGQCTKECWNAFGKTLQLTGEWQTFEFSFAELRQLDGWGVPRPPSLTTTKVKHFEWAIDQGEAFDVWVDDVQLLTCK